MGASSHGRSFITYRTYNTNKNPKAIIGDHKLVAKTPITAHAFFALITEG